MSPVISFQGTKNVFKSILVIFSLCVDNFEQKFNLPDDVDANRVSSGISRDGILMIRVPRRSPERIIPIQYDAKVSAVQKALREVRDCQQHLKTFLQIKFKARQTQ